MDNENNNANSDDPRIVNDHPISDICGEDGEIGEMFGCIGVVD